MSNKLEIAKIKHLQPAKLEQLIEEKIGIGVQVKADGGKLFILCHHHGSCYELMKRMIWDFDYTIHKRGKKYLFEI